MILRMLDRDVAVGLPGGRRIVSVSAQMSQRVVDFGATSHEASAAPRLHLIAKEPAVVSESVEASIVEGLKGMGHEVRPERSVAGAAHCAEVLKGEGRVRAGGNTWAAGVG
jgi:gamma-glutamyltranspeptidase